jgi:hypothetical protein
MPVKKKPPVSGAFVYTLAAAMPEAYKMCQKLNNE